jgi:hypothetical protein
MIVLNYRYAQYNVASGFAKAKFVHIHIFHDHFRIDCQPADGLWNPKCILVATYYSARVSFVR